MSSIDAWKLFRMVLHGPDPSNPVQQSFDKLVNFERTLHKQGNHGEEAFRAGITEFDKEDEAAFLTLLGKHWDQVIVSNTDKLPSYLSFSAPADLLCDLSDPATKTRMLDLYSKWFRKLEANHTAASLVDAMIDKIIMTYSDLEASISHSNRSILLTILPLQSAHKHWRNLISFNLFPSLNVVS